MRDQLVDAGFADRLTARMVLKRLKTRSASQGARSSAEALRDLLRERVQAVRGHDAATAPQRAGLTRHDLKSGLDIRALAQAERDALREDKLLESVNLFLQVLDELDIGIRHGLFSGVRGPEPSEPAIGGHRLCRPGIQTPGNDTTGGAS